MKMKPKRVKVAAQQAHEANTLIEDSIVACFGFAAFRFMGGVTAKPACGLCAVRWAVPFLYIGR